MDTDSDDDNVRSIAAARQRRNFVKPLANEPPFVELLGKPKAPTYTPPPFTVNPNVKMVPSPDIHNADDLYCEQKLREWDIFEEPLFNELMCELMDHEDATKKLAKLKRNFYRRNGINEYLRQHGREHEIPPNKRGK